MTFKQIGQPAARVVEDIHLAARLAAANRIIADQVAALAQARAALVRASLTIDEALAVLSGQREDDR